MLGTILIIILILAVIGALPTWGHSKSWGYFPSGGLPGRRAAARPTLQQGAGTFRTPPGL